MQCGCHVRRQGRRGATRAGREHAGGRHGGEDREREGQYGNFTRRHGKKEKEKGRRRRERKVQEVCGIQETMEGHKAEKREEIGYGVHSWWNYHFDGFFYPGFAGIRKG